MGTSICHVLLGAHAATVEGMCGMVEDGVVPGLFGFEAGQSAVGDIFSCPEVAVLPALHEEAADRGCSLHERLEGQGGGASPCGKAGCSRSTGGTATARCSSMPNCVGCWSG